MNLRAAARGVSLALLTALAATSVQARAQGKLGIVFMHGKQGNPLHLSDAPASFERAGYLVAMPEMCWSGRRIYDRTFDDCLLEVDAAVAQLKARGASTIVVGGHSLGGSGALGYGARHPGLAGILTSAPAPNLHGFSTQPGIAEEVARARQMVAAGRGEERADFKDYNVITSERISFTVHTTPRIYLSFYEIGGPADLGVNAARLTAPLLLLSGDRDPSQGGAAQTSANIVFGLAPANPLNRHIKLANTDHLGTLTSGTGAMIDWLRALPQR